MVSCLFFRCDLQLKLDIKQTDTQTLKTLHTYYVLMRTYEHIAARLDVGFC